MILVIGMNMIWRGSINSIVYSACRGQVKALIKKLKSPKRKDYPYITMYLMLVGVMNIMFTGWHDIASRPTHQFESDIDTHQSQWELCELVNIYRELLPERILEIGSFRGGTLYQWLTNAPRGAVVVNVDNFDSMSWMTNKTFIQDFVLLWKSWCPKGVTLETIVDDSHNENIRTRIARILAPSIDFLFIDADHSYEAVRQDFEMYGTLVRKGGVIALHDIKQQDSRPNYGVWKLWDEIKSAGYVTRELKVNADGKGIGVIYV